MILPKILRQREGRYDPKDFEGVLPVLDRRLYDGCDGGVVLCAALRPEASADLEFGLGGPERLLAVIVRGRNGRVCQEGEDVVPVLGDALLEFVQVGVGAVGLGVDRRHCKKLVKPLLHLGPHVRSDVPHIPMMYGVPQKVEHIEAPPIVREGLHRVCEVPQQVCDAYLVVLHPDVSHEVCRPAVGHPYLFPKFLRGEVAGDGAVAPAAVEGEVRCNAVLESPEPVVPAADIDSRLVSPRNFPGNHLLAYHLVRLLGELPHRVQHVGYGALAYVKSEDGLQQMGQPFERHVLIGAQIGHESRNVGTEVYRGVHGFRELPFAAVAAAALDLHQKMVYDLRGYRKRDVYLLSSCAHGGGVHIQWLAAHRADRRRIPALGSGDVVSPEPRTARMSLLPACLPSGRLALGLRVRNADRVLRGRHAAVRAGLDDGLGLCSQPEFEVCDPCLKVRDFFLSPKNLLVLADKVTVEDIIHTSLLVKLFHQLRGVKILGEAHLSKELFAPTGEFYPVSFKALAKPGIEVLFHTTKIRKRNDSTRFNKLCINGLKDVCGLLAKIDALLCGGPDRKYSRTSYGLEISNNRLIFNELKVGCAIQ